MYKPKLAVVGSPELYNMVRAAFVSRGTSLNAWCKANGQNRQTVERALKGERFSPRSHELRNKIVLQLFGSESDK